MPVRPFARRTLLEYTFVQHLNLNALRPLAAALAAALSLGVHADERVHSNADELDAIVVHGLIEAELPNAATLSGEALHHRRQASSDAARLLEALPGISLYSAGGVSSLPAIRGLADDRVRIKLDGVDLIASCPNHMNPPLSYVAPSQVSAAKVYAGITPVSVGGDSIGGSIVVDTLIPSFSAEGQGWRQQGRVGAHYRSNGDAWGVDLEAWATGERLVLGYSGSHAEADNYQAAAAFKTFDATGRVGRSLPRDEVGSSAYETRNHQLFAAARFARGVLDLKLGLQDMPFQGFPNQRMDLVDNQQTRGSLRWRGELGDGLLDVRAWHEEVDHRMDFGPDRRFWYGADSMVMGSMMEGRACAPLSFTCAAGMPMVSESRNSGLSWRVDLPGAGGAGQWRIGGDYQAYRLDDYWPASGGGMWPGEFVNIADGLRDRDALFGEWEQRIAPRWTALLGLRVEHVHTGAGPVRGYDIDPAPPGSAMMTVADARAFNARPRVRRDDNLDATALFRFEATPTLDIDFGVARKSRSPNLYERYTWSTWSMAAAMNNPLGDGNGYVGDPDLKPEVAHTLSASIDWRSGDGRRRLVLSPWYTEVDNFIDAERLSDNPGSFNVLRYRNQDARLAGIDLSGQWAIAESRIGRFDLAGVVGYIDAENRDSGDGLYQIMPLNARLTLSHRYGDWESSVELLGVSRKDDVSALRGEVETPGYALLNLGFRYSLGDAQIDLGIDNLLDRFYVQPLGGTYVGQGATMMLTGIPAGIGVPGPGRSLRVGFSLGF